MQIKDENVGFWISAICRKHGGFQRFEVSFLRASGMPISSDAYYSRKQQENPVGSSEFKGGVLLPCAGRRGIIGAAVCF